MKHRCRKPLNPPWRERRLGSFWICRRCGDLWIYDWPAEAKAANALLCELAEHMDRDR